MIIDMSKVRILGPRERLPDVLRALQDLGILHLAAPTAGQPLTALQLSPEQERERRHLLAALEDVERAMAELGLAAGSGAAPRGSSPTKPDFARWARLAWRARRAAERLKGQAAGLEEERALILKYQHFFSAFRASLESEARWPNATAYHVLLKHGDTESLHRLRTSLTAVIGNEYQLYTQPLPTGETALLVVVSAQAAGRVERLMAEARVEEIPIPAAYGGASLTDAIPRMLARLGEIPQEQEKARREREALARQQGGELRRARAGLHDRLQELGVLPLSGVTARAFVLEGWVPADARNDLEGAMRSTFGDDVVVSALSSEEWESEDAPVVLANPRLFRPFETLIRLPGRCDHRPRGGYARSASAGTVFIAAFWFWGGLSWVGLLTGLVGMASGGGPFGWSASSRRDPEAGSDGVRRRDPHGDDRGPAGLAVVPGDLLPGPPGRSSPRTAAIVLRRENEIPTGRSSASPPWSSSWTGSRTGTGSSCRCCCWVD